MLRRRDLRIPFPHRFRQRLTGMVVVSLTRRAKYLVAGLSSGETLIMHLGMSGSFRAEMIGGSHHAADAMQKVAHERHDHVLFRMSSGAIVTFNDPRRFGLMDLVKAGQLATHPILSKLGPEPLADDFDGAVLARACRGKRTALESDAPRSAGGRRPREHLRQRGPQSCRAVAVSQSVDDCHRDGPAAADRRSSGRRDQGRADDCHRSRLGWRATAGRGSGSTTARVSPAPRRGAAARSGRSRRRAGRRSTARAASGRFDVPVVRLPVSATVAVPRC